MPGEPLHPTLEEAAQLIADTPDDRGPRSLALTPAGWAVVTWLGAETAAYALEGHHETWPEAVSAALGRSVVARDDTAELIEVLEGLLNNPRPGSPGVDVTPENISDYDASVMAAYNAEKNARAVLARVKGEQP